MQTNEFKRTLIFLIVAGLFVGIASMAHIVSKPTPPDGFEREGEAFYPEFNDPNSATSLEVIAFNADKTEVKTFTIKEQDGQWVIPPYNYPADVKIRFAKTVSSIIGIKRGTRASTLKSEYKKFQVGDPLQYNPEDSKSLPLSAIGNRITLKGEGDKVLFDLIIGKEHEKRKGQYYVRHPRENFTWLAELNLDVSTKFSDWIDTDLLGAKSEDVRSIDIKRYSVNEQEGVLEVEEITNLSRETETTPWSMKGLNTETEELDSSHINTLLGNLTSITIVGVRPKMKGINADLTIDPAYAQNPIALRILKATLQKQGFFLDTDEQGKPVLYSNKGEVITTTKDGISYDLYFGELFSGDEYDIEVGFTSDEKEPSEKDNKSGDKKEEKKKEEKESKAGLNKSRYLFVTARFNEDALGNKPVAPVKPTEPKKEAPPKKELKKPVTEKKDVKKKTEAKEDKKKKETPKNKDDVKKETPKKEEDEKKAKSVDKKPETKKEDKKKTEPTPQEVYKKQLDKYNSDLIKFEKNEKERQQKIEDGIKKAAELNKRFGKWYYVISADSFENLRLSRKDLVKPKEKKPAEGATTPPSFPKGTLPPGFKLPSQK